MSETDPNIMDLQNMSNNITFDFGFSAVNEEDIREETSTECQARLEAVCKIIYPLLENLKKYPDKNMIKWDGKVRVEQIDAVMNAINKIVYNTQ